MQDELAVLGRPSIRDSDARPNRRRRAIRCQERGATMIANVGGADRVARAIVGLAIIGAGLYFKSWWGAIGVLPLLTVYLRWCPAYLPFGISSSKAKSA
jgi:hypothetical protein